MAADHVAALGSQSRLTSYSRRVKTEGLIDDSLPMDMSKRSIRLSLGEKISRKCQPLRSIALMINNLVAGICVEEGGEALGCTYRYGRSEVTA